ncbi:hypothetical protein L596_016828 [Steinernema carpocapsae]|uniref:F-box domain-containing protein n=1 Tax=Steinernema carpocapsae TaxID=34508 RepID=A0A4U5NKB0_STECR|nr:hypothetical protein L596_016828 [Steinernema carpocapsae]
MKRVTKANVLDALPAEVILRILGHCDLFTLLQFRQTCQANNYTSINLLWRRRSLNVFHDYYLPYAHFCKLHGTFKSILRSRKLLNFIQNFISEDLYQLVLKKAPVTVSTSDFIRLASYLPSVIHLDIGQPNGEWPQFDDKVVYALAYFRKLKTLKIDGTFSKRVVRRGGAHFDPTYQSIRVLSSLEHFEMDCYHDTLTKILMELASTQTILPYLRRIKFSVKHTSVSYPEHLIWFLAHHKNLEDVRIYNALFATLPQIEQFYSALCALPKLRVLVLERCSFCDRIDHSLQREFLTKMEKKAVFTVGAIQNMRFDPDNNH